MRHVDIDSLLDEVTTEYHNITIEDRRELLKWSLMNNKKEFYDILLNDPELEDIQRVTLKYLLNNYRQESIYNMVTHKNFKVNLSMGYYTVMLEHSYKRHSKLYDYVIDNAEDIIDNISITLVKEMVKKFDSDAVCMCLRSNILCESIMRVDATLLPKMKKIMIVDRRKKLKKLKERIHEKREA